MRSVRLDRLLRRNPLSTVQVGFEVHFTSQRSRIVGQARSRSRSNAVSVVPIFCSEPLSSNILIPQVRMRPDKLLHHLNALFVIEHNEIHSSLPE